ncbi:MULTISPECIES: amidohydrolase family protein [Streptomyces]|uniref:Amidohydrolase family protein n=1 Tax=Streptomyces spinosisporus TaxID=2927582 RepID=A0ABS9XA17_9ACTN|nr:MULTISPECIES: amidohydrolase family protein [Streptomyces]MCI3238908.1 amidohydrolase family protein [Streptomyces spinosisporus]WUB34714.1 amidohydrolase family protein [Streptomyces sp. NBC_00588]
MTQRTLIKGGIVYSVDPGIGELPCGDVLVEDDVIVAVGEHIPASDAHVIDAGGKIVLPGLVDTHRHLWQAALRQLAADWTLGQYIDHMLLQLGPRFSPEDVYVAELLGAVEAIDAGVTTVMDWAHIMRSPDHADEAVRGLKESGVRAVFGYGNPGGPPAPWYTTDVTRVAERHFSSDSGLVTFALASMGPEFGPLDDTLADLRLARDLGIRTSLHVGVGLLGRQRSITELHRRGLLGPDLIFVHCNTCTDAELRLIADTGGHASISPRVEMQMGHGYPATGRLRSAGVTPSLSIDVVSGVGGSLFAEMRGTLEAERGWQHHVALSQDEALAELTITTRDVVRMATIEGARTLGLERRIGSLTPGKQADIILLDTDRPNLSPVNNLSAAITLADNENVDTVLIAGQIVKRHGSVTDHHLRGVQARARSSRDRLLEAWSGPRTATASAVLPHA